MKLIKQKTREEIIGAEYTVQQFIDELIDADSYIALKTKCGNNWLVDLGEDTTEVTIVQDNKGRQTIRVVVSEEEDLKVLNKDD